MREHKLGNFILQNDEGFLKIIDSTGQSVDVTANNIINPLVRKLEQAEDELELVKGKILIDEYVFEEMQERLRFLDALEYAGVDNWSGYGYAYELMEEDDDE